MKPVKVRVWNERGEEEDQERQDVHEYTSGDSWQFSERSDGVWLEVVGADGRQVAGFPASSYERVESGRMKKDD